MAKTSFRNDYRKYYDEVMEYSIAVHRKFGYLHTLIYLLYGIGLVIIEGHNNILACVMSFLISGMSLAIFLVSYFRIIKNKKVVEACYNIFLLLFLIAVTLLYFFQPGHLTYTLIICSIITTAMTNTHQGHYLIIMSVVVIIDNVLHFSMQDVGNGIDIFRYVLNDIMIFVFTIGINTLFSNMKFMEFKQKNFLQNESYHDPLTNIYNRRYVERYVDLHFDGTSEWAMFLLDVDNFKFVNDKLGHEYGDELLCRISDNLRNIFRKTDCVARIGGDEFIVLMPKIEDKSCVIEKAKSILGCFPIEIEDSYGYQSINVSVSIGIAFTKIGVDTTYEEMYRKADMFMYKAKEKGKGVAVMEGLNGKREQMIV